jgi:hypothetical protein
LTNVGFFFTVSNSSQNFLSRLLIFVNALTDTDVAWYVEVEGTPSNSKTGAETVYTDSNQRTRVLLRKLEALIQSIYEREGILLVATQEHNNKPFTDIIPFMEQVSESVLVLEQLYEIGRKHAARLASGGDEGFDNQISTSRKVSMGDSISRIEMNQSLILDDFFEQEEIIDLEAALSSVRKASLVVSDTAVRQFGLSPIPGKEGNHGEDLEKESPISSKRTKDETSPISPEGVGGTYH